MDILVTGGAGYIGSVLVPLLLERGPLVTVIEILCTSSPPCWTAVSIDKLTIIRGDVRDRRLLGRNWSLGRMPSFH